MLITNEIIRSKKTPNNQRNFISILSESKDALNDALKTMLYLPWNYLSCGFIALN